MTTGYSIALRNAQLDAITAQVGNAGLCAIYDGARPATGGAATTKLAEFTMGAPFAPGAVAAVLSPTLPSSTTGLAAGTATWFRISSSGGTQVIDGSAGTSGTDMILDTAAISVGQPVSMVAFTISRGNA